VCVCVCVCERERERERESDCVVEGREGVDHGGSTCQQHKPVNPLACH